MNSRSVNLGIRVFLLAPDGGGDFTVQLPAYTLGSQQTDLFQRIHRQLMIRIRTKGGRILLHIWSNQLFRLAKGSFKPAAFKVS